MTQRWIKMLAVAFTALLTSLQATAAEVPSEPRMSTITFQNNTVQNHYPAASSEPDTTLPNTKRTVQNYANGLWVFDLFIDLTTDVDYDGHYSSFTVSLDIESNFSPQTVYAVFYLRQENGLLLEYAATDNFVVDGSGSHDAIFIESSLDAGYPSGYYDHYVEIYDAYDNSLLLSYGPNQSSHAHNIPFESYTQDNFVSTVGVRLSVSSTGSLTLTTLLIFIGIFGLQRYTRNNHKTF